MGIPQKSSAASLAISSWFRMYDLAYQLKLIGEIEPKRLSCQGAIAMRRGSGARGSRLNYPPLRRWSQLPREAPQGGRCISGSYKLARGKPSILRCPRHRQNGPPGTAAIFGGSTAVMPRFRFY